MEFSSYLRPEFFYDIGGHVDSELDPELFRSVRRCPVVLVIRLRNRHCGRIAKDFRIIELRRSIQIAMGPQDLTHCVAEPGPTTSRTASKIARILVKERRVDSFRHVIADEEVAVCSAKIFSVPSGALPESPIPVRRLVLRSENSRQHHGSRINGIPGSKFKLLACCQRLVVLQARRGPVIWNDPKKSLVLVRWCCATRSGRRARLVARRCLLSQSDRREKS